MGKCAEWNMAKFYNLVNMEKMGEWESRGDTDRWITKNRFIYSVSRKDGLQHKLWFEFTKAHSKSGKLKIFTVMSIEIAVGIFSIKMVAIQFILGTS